MIFVIFTKSIVINLDNFCISRNPNKIGAQFAQYQFYLQSCNRSGGSVQSPS